MHKITALLQQLHVILNDLVRDLQKLKTKEI